MSQFRGKTLARAAHGTGTGRADAAAGVMMWRAGGHTRRRPASAATKTHPGRRRELGHPGQTGGWGCAGPRAGVWRVRAMERGDI